MASNRSRFQRVNDARTSAEGMRAFAAALEFYRLVRAHGGVGAYDTVRADFHGGQAGPYGYKWFRTHNDGSWQVDDLDPFDPNSNRNNAEWLGVADPVQYLRLFLRNHRAVLLRVEISLHDTWFTVWKNDGANKTAAGLRIASTLERAALNTRFAYARRRLRREFANLSANRTENVTRPLARNIAQRAVAKAVTTNNRRQAARSQRPQAPKAGRVRNPKRPAYSTWGGVTKRRR